MFGISHLQMGIYAGIAAVLLLVGFNSLRGEPTGSAETVAFDSGAAGDTAAGFAIAADTSRLVVDVSGGVRRPGVYRLNQGDRVIDAIEKAGGPVARALPGAINRAAKLADGQQVVVPVRAEGPAGTTVAGAAGAGSGAAAGPISLGSATAAQLDEIEGIGPVTAAAILEYRDSQGGLGSIDELDQVSGIGPVTMEALRAGLQP